MNGPSHLFLERGQNGHSSVKHKLALQPKTEEHEKFNSSLLNNIRISYL